MTSFPRTTIIHLCQVYGLQLRLPAGIDGPTLMWAIAGAESSFGKNCTPRHEPAYDVGGYYATRGAMPQLLAQFGRAAACSYGPWQVMLACAPQFTPTQLADPEYAARAFVDHMNGYVAYQRPQTVEQIAETYNSGGFGTNRPVGVLKYASQVQHYYESVHLPLQG